MVRILILDCAFNYYRHIIPERSITYSALRGIVFPEVLVSADKFTTHIKLLGERNKRD